MTSAPARPTTSTSRPSKDWALTLGQAAAALLEQRHPLVGGEQRALGRVVGHRHHHPVEEAGTAVDDVDVAVGGRVEATRHQGGDHSAPSFASRVISLSPYRRRSATSSPGGRREPLAGPAVQHDGAARGEQAHQPAEDLSPPTLAGGRRGGQRTPGRKGPSARSRYSSTSAGHHLARPGRRRPRWPAAPPGPRGPAPRTPPIPPPGSGPPGPGCPSRHRGRAPAAPATVRSQGGEEALAGPVHHRPGAARPAGRARRRPLAMPGDDPHEMNSHSTCSPSRARTSSAISGRCRARAGSAATRAKASRPGGHQGLHVAQDVGQAQVGHARTAGPRRPSPGPGCAGPPRRGGTRRRSRPPPPAAASASSVPGSATR